MYFLILIWVADISAYFAGKKWGITKLAPEISPGKTVAGMYGALIAGLVCAVVLSLIYGFQSDDRIRFYVALRTDCVDFHLW